MRRKRGKSRKAVKLDSNIGKCIVEKKLSQRIEKFVAGFSHILYFIQFPQESTVLINGKVAS